MKKLLVLILALIMCLTALTSCDQVKGFIDGIINPEKPGVETPVETETQADGAITLLKSSYKDWYKTAADYTLDAFTHQGDVKVEWSVNVGEEYVKITHDYDKSVVYVDVNEESAVDVEYVLTAKVTDAEGNVRTISFNLLLPKDKLTTYDELVAANKDDTLKVQGIVTGIIKKADGWSANSLYLQDEENKGGYYAYNLSDEEIAGVEVGMTVKVVGTKDTYNGIFEVMKGKVTIVDTTIKTVTPVDYTEVFTNAADTKAEDLIYRQSMLVTVKGVEISTQNADNGYLNFKLAGKEAYIRISSSNNCITKDEAAALKTLHAANFGNTADVTGIIQLYNGAFYLIPATGVPSISNIKAVEKTPAEKVETEFDGLDLVGEVASNKEITLPSAGSIFSDVSITWTLTENAAAVIDNGVLKVTLQNEATTLTLKATITCGEVSKEKTFEIAVAAIPKTVNVVVDAPVVGNEYYFMMHHDTLDKDLFITGEMDGFYYATTDSVDGAVKVKVVDAGEGAYYLMVGSKYVTIIKNDTYINVVFVEEAPAAKFTWNTEFKTFVINVDGTDYIYGTRNDKTYQTFSACKLEKANDTFIAHLVEVKNIGANVVDAPVVGSEYFFMMYHETLNKNLFITGEMDGFYYATTESVDGAVKVKVVDAGEGAYYLMVGSKYVTIIKNDTYINVVFVDEAPAAKFTWNTEFKTFVINVDGTDYIYGTRNDKTYQTFSACKLEKANDTFIAHLVEWVEDPNAAPAPEHTHTVCDECGKCTAEDCTGEKCEGHEEAPEVTVSTIATILAGENGNYVAAGTVVAVNGRSFLLQDATGMMLVYLNKLPEVVVGDTVTVSGVTSVYGGAKQFGNTSVVTKTGTATVSHGTAKELTAAECDAYLTAASVTPIYVKVSGVLGISGNYMNLPIEGATIVGSLTYMDGALKDAATALNGKTIVVEGYVTGVTGSTTKYLNLMVVSVAEATGSETPAPEHTHTVCDECGKCTAEDCTGEKCEGHEEAPATSAEETFAIVASAGTLSSSKTSVSWSSANFNFVAEKGTNNNNPRVTDTDHFRIYQGNNFSITGKNGEKITKVVFTTLSASYADVLATSLNNVDGYTATVSDKVVTVVIANGTTSVAFTTTAQTRVNNIVVTYEK